MDLILHSRMRKRRQMLRMPVMSLGVFYCIALLLFMCTLLLLLAGSTSYDGSPSFIDQLPTPKSVRIHKATVVPYKEFQKQQTIDFLQQNTEHYAAHYISIEGRRFLSGPGSSPPRCISKCGKCTPCKAVHVPVPPGTPITAEYYPEAWRCKCGNKLYMP